mgnify:CR=1 FL=1
MAAVLEQASPGPRDVSILYSPLHGVGASAVVPVLEGAGFAKLSLYGPQANPDGDFPNVPGHVSNPENPAVMDGAVETIRRDCANTVEEKIANARIRRVNMRRSPSKRGFTTNEGTGLLTSGLAMMSDLPACAVIARRDYLPVTVAGQRRTFTVFPNIPTLTNYQCLA